MQKIIVLFLVFININTYGQITNETEISLLQSGGNSVVETYNSKTEFTLKKEKRVYSFGGHYTLSSSEKIDDSGEKETVESARNWDAHARYEQELSKHINGFSALQYQGDEFSGYKQRQNIDFGGKYIFKKTDQINSFIELGLRYTVEKTTKRDEDDEDEFNYSKGRLYYEFSNKVSNALFYKFWVEYIPNFSESEDYLLSAEPSLSFVLSETFSLKTGYKGIYDNQPALNDAGEKNKYLDYIFTTSLIAKF